MRRQDGRRIVIGVIGTGANARPADIANARRLGELIARAGWVLLTGGRDAGVMRAANEGAKQVAGSLTLGILPSATCSVAPGVDIAIVTDMGSARNNINVLSSQVVVACGATGSGTVSEIALALKAGRAVVLLGADATANAFFQGLGGDRVQVVANPAQAIEAVRRALATGEQAQPD